MAPKHSGGLEGMAFFSVPVIQFGSKFPQRHAFPATLHRRTELCVGVSARPHRAIFERRTEPSDPMSTAGRRAPPIASPVRAIIEASTIVCSGENYAFYLRG